MWAITNPPPTPPSQNPSAATSPKPKSTSSMAAISLWTPPPTKSPHSSAASSVLHLEAHGADLHTEGSSKRVGDLTHSHFQPHGTSSRLSDAIQASKY